jgi:hypothetical protein
MKIAKPRRAILTIALIVAAIAAIAVAGWVSAASPAAEEMVGKSMDSLTDQGVPVKSWALEGTTLTVSLQSASASQVQTPDDPTYLSLVEREAFLAKSRGVELSTLKLELTNTDGKPLFVGEIPLNAELEAVWSKSPALSEAETVAALERALADNQNLIGLTIDTIGINLDRGVREIHIAATTRDVESANGPTAPLMITLYCAVNNLNDQKGAQIALVQLDMVDKAGGQLLKWIYDVQRGSQDWWQAPGMTTDWFESPPPEEPIKTAIEPD